MPQRDVAQLILEVDARIATAQRAVNQLAKAVTQDAAAMDTALGKVSQSHQRLGKALNDNGRLRAGFTQLSFQIGDVTQQMSLGVSASRIFAQQSGQVIQALQVMGGEGNKFLQFMGGPWGIATSTAAVILGSLIPPLLESKDKVGQLVDKMREQAGAARDQEAANKIWATSIDGVREAQEKLRKELEQSLRVEEVTRQQNLDDARSRLGTQQGALPGLQRKLSAAESELKRQSPTRSSDPDAPGAPQALAQRVRDLRKQVADLKKDIADSQRTITDAELAISHAFADATASASTAIQQQSNAAKGLLDVAVQAGNVTVGAAEQARIALNTYAEAQEKAAQAGANVKKSAATRQIEELTKSFSNGRTSVTAYVAALNKAIAALNKAAAAAVAAKKSGADTDFSLPVHGTVTGRFGEKRPGHIHQGVDIAVPVGTNVKAPAAGTIIEAGVLPGYGNVVFIDHGSGTITRLAHLSKIGVTKGQQVDAGSVIGLSGGAKGSPGAGDSTGPHLHYEVLVGGKAVNPLTGKFRTDQAGAAMQAQSSAESAAERAIRQQNAFEEELDRLNQDLIRAKGDLLQGTDAQARFAEQQVFAAERAYNAAKDHDVEEGKITQANAEALKGKYHEVTVEKLKAIETDRQIKLIQEQSELEQRRFQYQIDDLRFADEMARTAAERRQIELAILDALYAQKKAELEAAKAAAEKAGNTKAAADAQAALDRLPTEKAHDQARTLRGTMSPLQQWADQVPQTAKEINEALQSIEARGLDSLTDALTDVIMGTKSLGEAFGDVARSIIADIIQMTIRMLIFRAISGMIGGPAPTQGFVGPPSANGNVFSHGSIVPHRLGGVVSQLSYFPMPGGKVGSMAEDGPEAIMPLGRDAMGRLGVRATSAGRGGAGGGGPIELVIGFGDAPDFAPFVQAVSAAHARQAVKLSVSHTDSTLRNLSKPKLMGR